MGIPSKASVFRLLIPGALLLFGLWVLIGWTGNSPDETRRLQVYAASSLIEAFGEMARSFEAAHPGTEIVLNFAGSQILRLQIEHGAPADIFASADPGHMRALIRAKKVEGSRVFAHNELAVIVPSDNPAAIESFEDLPRSRRLVVGAKQVPVGAYTRKLLRGVGDVLGPGFSQAVAARVVSEEHNVRLVRAKVALGEADAAIVYLTDARNSQNLSLVPIPDALNLRVDYSMGRVLSSGPRALAASWSAFVLGREGQEILARHGFRVD